MINVINFAGIIQHVNHIFALYYVASSMACLLLLCYSSPSRKRHEFSKKKIPCIQYVLIFATKFYFLKPISTKKNSARCLKFTYISCNVHFNFTPL
jgi:hypothetical protein